MSDLEMQQYLFDLQGYLVVEDALSTEEVATLNELFDRQQLPSPGKVQRFGDAPEGSGFLQWGKPFCESDTSGRAGGLKNREPLEAVENRGPPKGGYSSNNSICSSLRSASSCSWMYLRTDSSSLPTVET